MGYKDVFLSRGLGVQWGFGYKIAGFARLSGAAGIFVGFKQRLQNSSRVAQVGLEIGMVNVIILKRCHQHYSKRYQMLFIM